MRVVRGWLGLLESTRSKQKKINSALFFSIFIISIYLQVISELGHGRDRRMRLVLIAFGECDR
jgi:hypothetical protein